MPRTFAWSLTLTSGVRRFPGSKYCHIIRWSCTAAVSQTAVDHEPGPYLRKLSDPDISEADWLALIAVCLQLDWSSIIFLIEGLTYIKRLAL